MAISVRLQGECLEPQQSAASPSDGVEKVQTALPIVVDLDGTLVLTDTLDESLAIGLLRRPLALLSILPALRQGRQAFKAALAREVDLSAHALPIREELAAWLAEQAAAGREIHLCTGASQAVAEAVAERLPFLNSAAGSGSANLTGARKAQYLKERFPGGFVYAGDQATDLPVWEASDGVVLAGATPDVARQARALGKPVEAEFTSPALGLREVFESLRVHHWTKNLLIFVPLVLAHQWDNLALFGQTLLAFACLIAVASGTYLLNDIADLNSDRLHWSKRHRALASGRMPLRFALGLSVLLVGGGLIAATLVSAPFALVLLAYMLLTCGYSLALKSVPLLDTLVIGILFTLRLVMGAVLLDQSKPAWLLTFAVFFFVSLAIAKRHTEIVRARQTDTSLRGRGYEVEDAPITLALGISSAMASLVVLFIFIVLEMLPGDTYRQPVFLAGIPVVLAIWLGRIWLLAHRGRMNDDPVSFALGDRISILIGAMVAVLFVAAL